MPAAARHRLQARQAFGERVSRSLTTHLCRPPCFLACRPRQGLTRLLIRSSSNEQRNASSKYNPADGRKTPSFPCTETPARGWVAPDRSFQTRGVRCALKCSFLAAYAGGQRAHTSLLNHPWLRGGTLGSNTDPSAAKRVSSSKRYDKDGPGTAQLWVRSCCPPGAVGVPPWASLSLGLARGWHMDGLPAILSGEASSCANQGGSPKAQKEAAHGFWVGKPNFKFPLCHALDPWQAASFPGGLGPGGQGRIWLVPYRP